MNNTTSTDTLLKAVVKELRLMRKQVDSMVGMMQTDARNADRLITVGDAAKILNRSVDYVYDLLHSGRLGSSRLTPRGRHMLSENEVRRFPANTSR